MFTLDFYIEIRDDIMKKANSYLVGYKEKKSGLIHGSDIYNSRLVRLKENTDDRGSFTEVFQRHWGTVLDPVQWSLVKSEAFVFRGMHYHARHDEYFCLIQGSCFLGLKDIRPDSPTFLQHSLYYLTGRDMCALIFPKGIVHGWYFPEPSMHVQSVSEAYVDYGKDDNFGCQWNDADLGIPWPFDFVLLSERAKKFGKLKDLPPFSKMV